MNNIKPALREQSKVEEELKYRSVLTVCGRTVTPRVQSSSISDSLWGFSVLFQHAEQPGMQLLQCLNLPGEPDEPSGIRPVTKNKHYYNFIFNRCLIEPYKNPLYFLMQTEKVIIG